MQNIRVQFTVPDVKEVVNLDVRINGEQRHMKFRVVTFPWQEEREQSETLIRLLRNSIENYDQNWELYHIGTPAGEKIPVTFRYRQANFKIK